MTRGLGVLLVYRGGIFQQGAVGWGFLLRLVDSDGLSWHRRGGRVAGVSWPVSLHTEEVVIGGSK